MDEIILNDFNLSLSNDAVFKHYYSVASNLSVLVSLILGEEVLPEDITYLSNEVIITPKVKKPRFDLRILIQNELNIDLEMQNNKEKYFHIYIDPVYLEYNGAVDQLFVSGDQLFFTYIDTVNSMYPSNYIDKSGVSIIKKENLSVVTVKLSY